MNVVNRVTSSDGTSIAFERSGAGPALILVDAAGSYRDFRPLRAPVELLAADFTVVTYDRRGRGGSTDTQPYAIEREVDDLAALIGDAGGSAFVYAMSSGALLALHAAASGLAIPKLALFEPPIEPNEAPTGETDFTTELAELVAAGRRRDLANAVGRKSFHANPSGIPLGPAVHAAAGRGSPTPPTRCRRPLGGGLALRRVESSVSERPQLLVQPSRSGVSWPSGTCIHDQVSRSTFPVTVCP